MYVCVCVYRYVRVCVGMCVGGCVYVVCIIAGVCVHAFMWAYVCARMYRYI